MKIICSPRGIVDEKRPKNGWLDIRNAGFTDEMDDVSIILPVFENIERQYLWDRNREYYLAQWKNLCAQEDVQKKPQILLQNLTEEVNGHMVRGVCADAYEACQWIDALNDMVGMDTFGICVDTGALNLCGQNMYEYISALGHRVKAVILRENDGHHDYSMLPFTSVARGHSQMDWLGVIRALREIAFDGYLIVDLADTASAFSPLLRPQLLSMAKSVAEYFKWQIEIETHLKKYEAVVLFGAGNMCRNYMKCYGEKYPPLFTCDNNEKLWGQEFCGLEIRSPESLMDLPENCTILICNIYYREIEKQLRDMNIKNDISYFNDEYMPSFYFDRIER